MQGQAAVAGIGESAYYVRGRSPDSEFKLCVDAIAAAVADAGLELADIDGFVSYMDQRNDPLRLAHALGIRELRWAAQTWAGGGNNAAAAIDAPPPPPPVPRMSVSSCPVVSALVPLLSWLLPLSTFR